MVSRKHIMQNSITIEKYSLAHEVDPVLPPSSFCLHALCKILHLANEVSTIPLDSNTELRGWLDRAIVGKDGVEDEGIQRGGLRQAEVEDARALVDKGHEHGAQRWAIAFVASSIEPPTQEFIGIINLGLEVGRYVPRGGAVAGHGRG